MFSFLNFSSAVFTTVNFYLFVCLYLIVIFTTGTFHSFFKKKSICIQRLLVFVLLIFFTAVFCSLFHVLSNPVLFSTTTHVVPIAEGDDSCLQNRRRQLQH